MAAGVLSVGLLFVVAGYAWPDGGAMTVQAEPNVASTSDSTFAPVPAEATAAMLHVLVLPSARPIHWHWNRHPESPGTGFRLRRMISCPRSPKRSGL